MREVCWEAKGWDVWVLLETGAFLPSHSWAIAVEIQRSAVRLVAFEEEVILGVGLLDVG
jgi:hypothetical protein